MYVVKLNANLRIDILIYLINYFLFYFKISGVIILADRYEYKENRCVTKVGFLIDFI